MGALQREMERQGLNRPASQKRGVNVITGDRKIDRVLAELPIKLQKKPVRKAMRIAAKLVLEDAKAAAEPWDLAGSLKIKAAKFPRRSGKFGIKIETVKSASGTVTEDKPFNWDVIVEFGTGPRQTRATGANRGMFPSSPYLRPAIYDNKAEVASIVRTAVGQWLSTLRPKK